MKIDEIKQKIGVLIPLGDRVIIYRDKQARTTDSGIIIPENVDMKTSTGIVISIGENVEEVKPNDYVFFGDKAGFEMTKNNVDLLIIREDDIALVLH